ncbi:activating signal cointegrator 1 complex subunit 2 isoform X4 [Balaenoptera acutorostrata]|uniref:Activating signal cointegrator 1 complex subunit 2 isoform X4 n=1 Tax=Balaenoptera acutorostrata TaxID=9767 RepID=A0ABM3RXV5_BALAC|nr:activating signal cointegrator 1 complex subunit 2 isoform X4 [Balaenoptera acutorostrata]XP_057382428.1 activating signal cointegrator 1 complex subunit 2 isoform X4 [Balaenoptera acutorostrata]
MPALPLDQLQITHKDLKTGKLRTSPALVVFDETLQKCLDSYLHYVPRKFDEWVAPAPEVVDMEKRLHRSVFLTFLRMSTHKESKDHFISPSAFGEILYNNFLFDIPKILDLCVLFGKGNSPLLQKMIGNIFLQQPSYYNDLDETMPTILQVFSNILQHCGLQGDGACATPQKLEERGRLTPSDMPLLELKDIVLYLCDTCTTLWAFLDIFPLACPTFQKHDFCYRLASFYEIAIPELESAIKKRRLEDSKLLGDLWQRLSHSRKKLLEIFHILLNQICLLPVLESSCDNIQGFIEEFLQIFSSLLQEKRFLRDYDALFPVADDISLLQQASSALDETRTAYILQAVESAWEGVDRRKATNAKDPPVAENPNRVVEAAEAVSRPSSLPQNLEEEECLGAAAAPGPVCGVELDSLISQVKDLLPDLGEGFILACLEHYSYDPEQVINNILEGRLAPALSQLDHGLDRQVKPDPTPLLASRHNIFQNDEFDVFSRDSVDLSRVHKGRRKEESARSLLNDKREVVAQRRRYEQYSVVAEEVPVQPGEDSPYRGDDYEDEYDDTYDGNQVGANDADSDDELISRRPFTIPQVLRTKVPREGQEEDEEEEEEEAEDEAPKPDHFVQDPAVLREKAEARRMAFLARKGYRHDSSTAVAGNPRGHGQSRETTQERRKKESSKATRANHNRRTMTDRKRSKGMIPS